MTKRPHRNDKGMYSISGKQYKELFGSRQQVMNGTAYKTAGELTKSDLMMNKWGRIVSRKKHSTAKKEKRLLKHGYTAKKGKFGAVKISKKTRKSRKIKGGAEKTPAEELAEAKLKLAEAQKASNENPDDNDKQTNLTNARSEVEALEAKIAKANSPVEAATVEEANVENTDEHEVPSVVDKSSEDEKVQGVELPHPLLRSLGVRGIKQ